MVWTNAGHINPRTNKGLCKLDKWFNDYLRQKYTHYIGADSYEHQFLTGEDMYALRCSFLHAGEVMIDNQWLGKF